jgi:hypothetical protein
MPKPPTAADLALARMRAAFVAKYRLREFRLGAYNLMGGFPKRVTPRSSHSALSIEVAALAA